jgi:NAD(P)-dependent dehydrogenase (short-subunit alcohol dehydrogenase family)
MKTVLVTGASSGIGRASALAAATAGWNVFVGYSTGEERAADVVKTIQDQGGSAWRVHIDLGDPESCLDWCKDIERAGVGLSAIVLAAGSAPVLESFATIGAETLANDFNINVVGNYRLARAAWRGFFRQSRSGHVVALLSEAIGPPVWSGMTSYVVCKRALAALLECASQELGKAGLRVSMVRPEYTETPMLLSLHPHLLHAARSRQKSGRFLQPEAVAAQVLSCLEHPTDGSAVSYYHVRS